MLRLSFKAKSKYVVLCSNGVVLRKMYVGKQFAFILNNLLFYSLYHALSLVWSGAENLALVK